MALVRNFRATTGKENTISLNWDQPLGFNSTNDELIVTRTITHPPSELYNSNFPNSATDPRGIEIFRGSTIIGEGIIQTGNRSIEFTGSTQYIDLGTSISSNFDNTTPFSLSLWIKAKSLGSAQVLFSNFDPSNGFQGMELTLNSSNRVDFRLLTNGSGSIIRTSGTIITTGVWINIVATYDGSQSNSGMNMYFNGVLDTPVSSLGSITGTTLGTAGRLGLRANNTNSYDGFIDEFAAWDKELNLAEVQEIYNSGQANNLALHSAAFNIITWLQMGDGDTFPILQDNVGSNNGTMVNMAASNISLDSPSIPISTETIIDSSASFPTSPSLAGRLLRDSNSKVHKIVSNTAISVTLETSPAAGKYIILADFPTSTRPQENYEFDIRTISEAGKITNLVTIDNNILQIKLFEPDELINMIFMDAAGNKFIVKSNTETEVTFFETSIPLVGTGMSMLNSFFDSQPTPYKDNFLTDTEAINRNGTKLLDNKFYYYTIFTKEKDTNVARAEYATTDSGVSTQSFAISTDDTKLSDCLYTLWPTIARDQDTTGDLEDLMRSMGFQLNEVYALINTYNLQDPDNVLITALQPLSEQTGLPTVGLSIGADTLRRIARDMIPCWKLKGSKEGIAIFIRKITTWDITNGTADFSSAIQDFLPNVAALRFFDSNLGSLNTRLTETLPFVAGGRFARSLPGIVIPGFFTFREFVVNIPNVALYTGISETFTVGSGTTTVTDTATNFGVDDSLVGNYIIPNSEEINDIFEIVSNTSTSITVRGTINNRNPGGDYAILSPLNANRFQILNNLLPVFVPFGTRAGFRFITA